MAAVFFSARIRNVAPISPMPSFSDPDGNGSSSRRSTRGFQVGTGKTDGRFWLFQGIAVMLECYSGMLPLGFASTASGATPTPVNDAHRLMDADAQGTGTRPQELLVLPKYFSKGSQISKGLAQVQARLACIERKPAPLGCAGWCQPRDP